MQGYILNFYKDFLSDLLVYVEKAVIVGEFNFHFDNPQDRLRTVFASILVSVGVNQDIIRLTHYCGHTLDIILTFGLNIENTCIVRSYLRALSLLI